MDPAALLAALLVIDNVLRHEAPPPPHAPPVVRQMLAAPDEVDAARLFRIALPSLEQPAPSSPRPLQEVLDAYLVELAETQKALRSATGRDALDESLIVQRLREGLLSADQLLRVAASVDAPALERVNARFIEATLRFAHAARVATDFPAQASRFESPVGVVSIGTSGNDRHGPAALIVDPGGDDVYERTPTTRGNVSVIVDLGGDDRYTGSDVAVRGLSALVDFAGNDRYDMQTGLGSAIAGVSLLLDMEGTDSYSARFFSEGAAAFGFGALVDLAGNDSYRLQAWGQGFGTAGGVGLLWDRAGNDAYLAAGVADVFERGAGLSGAQGAAFGFRSMLGGGIGILRDDAGDDLYEAQMFAQGLGYFHGVGLLWDGAGNDRYRAVRYAQGSGVHQAVGILRDDSGDDRYELSFGVGQGMGLDLALGILFDGAGNDDYRGGLLVQGAATANGLGFLEDRGGSNRFEIGDDPHASGPLPRSWGHAEWSGGLPSVGLLEHRRGRASFVRPGRSVDGPPAFSRVDERTSGAQHCDGPTPEQLREALATLRPDHFDAVAALGEGLLCSISLKKMAWDEVERYLVDQPQSPLAPWIARARPEREQVLQILEKHPSCDVRAAALRARGSVEAAQAALRSSCWRLQAAALQELRRLGAAPAPDAVLPAFLQ